MGAPPDFDTQPQCPGLRGLGSGLWSGGGGGGGGGEEYERDGGGCECMT
jgi:hypothetical protein